MSDAPDANHDDDEQPGMLIDAPRERRVMRQVGYWGLLLVLAGIFVYLFNRFTGSWNIAVIVVAAMLVGMFLLARAGAGYFDE